MYSNWFVLKFCLCVCDCACVYLFLCLFLSARSLTPGRLVANPFHEGDQMTKWYHSECIFIALTRARATTKKIGLSAFLVASCFGGLFVLVVRVVSLKGSFS